MNKTYEVIDIYRTYGAEKLFTLALRNQSSIEHFKVNPQLSLKISQGLLFVGDVIRIVDEPPSGILFEIVQDEVPVNNLVEYIDEQDSLILSENTNNDKKYLPFLCDVLPYHKTPVDSVKATPFYKEKVFQGKYSIDNIEITNIKLPLPTQFIAKIHQKTRINMYPNTYNPFFFIILCSNNILLKAVFWRESLRKYSSLKVGEIVYIKNFKNKKKLPFIDRVEYNTFTESVYFDCEEITARELVKIETNKRGTIQSRFETIEGRVCYLSVLLRYVCNSCIMEYLLCRIDGKPVVLFYNSDDDFKRIKEGCQIRITELRRTTRAGFELYISTIYTQFEVNNEVCSEEYFNEIKDNSGERRSGSLEQSGKRMGTSPDRSKKMRMKEIFGAIGFVPDYFPSTNEILDYNGTEMILGKEVAVNLFMKPLITTVEELQKVFLLLNESKKHIIQATLVSVNDDELSIDYLENGGGKKQSSKKAVFEGGFECYYFQNFFEGEGKFYTPNPVELVGQQMYFVIESFRADLETVLHYIT
ncbi:hypothetical protein PAEPH01_2435, partial [Pancytospora epiphaga]